MPPRALTAVSPDFHEKRGDKHLLVWGGLGRWLVVDDDLWRLLGLLNGRRRLARALEQHARSVGRSRGPVEAEARPVLAELEAMGILTRTSRPADPPTESLGIANVTLNLTNRCNLSCPFCYNTTENKKELPVERLTQALYEGRGILDPGASLIILGGEPTLQMDRLERLLEGTAHLFTPRPTLSTNGTRLTSDHVRRLAKHRLEVQVSLDSPTAAGHDALRGEGTFEAAIQGVERLVAAEIPTILSMVFTASNIGEFEAYIDLALKVGAREARFIPLRLMGRGAEMGSDLPDLVQAFEVLAEILSRRPELGRLLRRDFFSILKTVCGHAGARSGCGVGARVIFIDADGRIFPCPNHRQEKLCLGSLADGGLEDLVRGSDVMEEVRQAYRVDNYPGCSGCPFRYWCAGDCRGEALNITGDPFASPPHCDELKALIPRLLWLMADEEGSSTVEPGSVHLG